MAGKSSTGSRTFFCAIRPLAKIDQKNQRHLCYNRLNGHKTVPYELHFSNAVAWEACRAVPLQDPRYYSFQPSLSGSESRSPRPAIRDRESIVLRSELSLMKGKFTCRGTYAAKNGAHQRVLTRSRNAGAHKKILPLRRNITPEAIDYFH